MNVTPAWAECFPQQDDDLARTLSTSTKRISGIKMPGVVGRFARSEGVPHAVAEHLKGLSPRGRSQSEVSASGALDSDDGRPRRSSTQEMLRSFRKELMAMKRGGSMFLQASLTLCPE